MCGQGLRGIWDDLVNFLAVDVEISQNEPPKDGLPVTVKFTVTNEGKASRGQPEIVFGHPSRRRRSCGARGFRRSPP